MLEYCTVETSDGVKLHTRIFNSEEQENGGGGDDVTVVLVHPYSILGGCQALLMGIATGLARRGYRALTFDMRGVGSSTGKPSLTGFKEIEDVVAVCGWAHRNLAAHKILLVGSSAGAPIAGSAVDKVEQVIGYVSLGYPFGLLASILFGRHHKFILKSPKPKLFVMGTRDWFTSVKQLKKKLKSAVGRADIHLLEGVGHFEMEGPAYDSRMAEAQDIKHRVQPGDDLTYILSISHCTHTRFVASHLHHFLTEHNMRNIHRSRFVLMLFLLWLHLQSCFAVRISRRTENRALFGQGTHSRKLLVSAKEGMLEKAITSELRQNPPSTSNPNHNK